MVFGIPLGKSNRCDIGGAFGRQMEAVEPSTVSTVINSDVDERLHIWLKIQNRQFFHLFDIADCGGLFLPEILSPVGTRQRN